MSTRWDPEQYLRYADERSRPFLDLLAQIPLTAPETIIDLGCGPGHMTVLLLERWPAATVIGVDSSAEMIEQAAAHAVPGRLSFVQSDLRDYEVAEPVDLLLSAATLQWVPGHLELLPRLLESVKPGGCLSFHVPGNFDAPSHQIARDLAATDRWRAALTPALAAAPSSHDPAVYATALFDAGAAWVDAWETTYLHLLQGESPVLEWIKGTGLRPFLLALEDDPDALAAFLATYSARLDAAYPRDRRGFTLFPFRRIFVNSGR